MEWIVLLAIVAALAVLVIGASRKRTPRPDDTGSRSDRGTFGGDGFIVSGADTDTTPAHHIDAHGHDAGSHGAQDSGSDSGSDGGSSDGGGGDGGGDGGGGGGD